MKQYGIGGVIIAAVFFMQSGAYAGNPAEQLASMLETSMREQTCADNTFLSCASVSADQCHAAMDSVIKQCHSRLPKNVSENDLENHLNAITSSWVNCVHDKMKSGLHLSESVIKKCEGPANENTGNPGAPREESSTVVQDRNDIYTYRVNNIPVVVPTCAYRKTDMLTGCWRSDSCAAVTDGFPYGKYSRFVLTFSADKVMHASKYYYHDKHCAGKPVYGQFADTGPHYKFVSHDDDIGAGAYALLVAQGDFYNYQQGTYFRINTTGAGEQLCFSENAYDSKEGILPNAFANPAKRINETNCLTRIKSLL